MPITTIPLGPWATNTHILHQHGQAVVIDAGDDPAPILSFLYNNNLKVSHICITHWHCDHVYGVAALQQATGVIPFLPAGDSYLKDTADAKGGDGWPVAADFAFSPYPAPTFSLGAFTLQVLETPGHTQGGVSLYCPIEKAVFVGDTLFYQGMGRTDFLGGSPKALLHSIEHVLFGLPEETKVYAGHGPSTTIGAERRFMGS